MSAARSAVQAAYDALLRPYLPRAWGTYNGVELYRPKLLDATKAVPDAETGLVTGLDRHADPGDTVAIVGGGWGLSSVTAAREVGPEGRVVAYEPTADQIQALRRSLAHHGVDDRVAVEHARVTDAGDAYGAERDADTLHPCETAIPRADVLVVDCEGGECIVLAQARDLPPVVIVEYHPDLGVSRERVVAELDRHSYAVADELPCGGDGSAKVLIATEEGDDA